MMRFPLEILAVSVAALFSSHGIAAPRTDRTFYANGQIAEQRSWIGTRAEGVQHGWWPNGTRRFDYTYHEGVMNGVAREWYPSGALFTEQHYAEGHEAGLQRMYWEDGRTRASYVIRGGRRYGLLGAKGCVTRDTVSEATP
jgi:antitoxin component YwqK of YwqJK toxin-antitoxin module